jgi:hypothetical protein
MFFNIKKYLDITNIFFNNLANQVLKNKILKKNNLNQLKLGLIISIYIFNIY